MSSGAFADEQLATQLVARHGHLTGEALLAAMIETVFAGRIAVVSSFGAESAVLLSMVAAVDPGVPVFFIDTGKLFGETLAGALVDFDAWISGRKRYQDALRSALPVIEAAQGRIKINPLACWSKAAIDAEFEARDLPRHPLEEDGFLSIGCMPCTARVAPGAAQRSGRWPGLQKTECGIHLRLRRAG